MTDRELLELAAKAAGVQLADPVDSHIPSGGVWIVGRGGRDTVWSPLTDDGDALRLAVKLWIEIRVFNGRAHAGKSDKFWCTEIANADELASTRRAIVRAAAEIGKAMP